MCGAIVGNGRAVSRTDDNTMRHCAFFRIPFKAPFLRGSEI